MLITWFLFSFVFSTLFLKPYRFEKNIVIALLDVPLTENPQLEFSDTLLCLSYLKIKIISNKKKLELSEIYYQSHSL